MINLIQTDEFAKWVILLISVPSHKKRISLTGNLGDTKSVGDGVYELRIDYGPGYRVYYAKRSEEILLLLIGGDKSSQQKDIEKAKKLNAEYE